MADLFLDVEKEAAEYNAVLLERWHDALEQSSNTLGDDKALAQSLGTPEAFLKHLEQEQQRSNAQWLTKVRSLVFPYIKAMKSFSVLFLALLAAPPTSAGFTIVWGVFFLSIQVCLQTEDRFQNMLEIHKSIRQTLLKISRLSSYLRSSLEEDEDFKEAVVDIYVVLVKFWVEAIKLIQETQLNPNTDEPWKTLKSRLNRAVTKVEEKYRYMKEVADDRALHGTGSANLPLRLEAGAMPKAQPKRPVFVLSIPENSQFQGRVELLERIHAHLNPGSRSTRLACFTIYGLGGVGKTQTAAAYAYKYGNQQGHGTAYDAVLWINSQNDESIRSSFADVAFALKLEGVNGTTGPDHIRRKVQNWLSDTDQTWLLIFDNVDCWDTITACWPPGTSKGSIIITSRDWSLADQPASAGEELVKLDPSDSRALFGKLLGSFPQDGTEHVVAFDQILKYLDGLPLAIHQVASIIRSNHYDLTKFLKLYKDNRSQMHQERGTSSYAFYKHTLHNVWMFPSGETNTTDGQLRHLLGVLSMLVSDSIPQDLLLRSVPLPGNDAMRFRKLYEQEMLLRSLLTKLRSTAMIRQSSDVISIHRLTQAAFIDFIDATQKNESFAVASMLVFDKFPKQHRGDPLLPHWKECSDFAPHARSLVERWQEFHEQGLAITAPVEYLREINDYDGALFFIETGISASKHLSTFTSEAELLVAHLRNTRGVVLWNHYDYTGSRRELQEALRVRTKHMEKDNIELIGTKANLASLVAAEGRYAEARELYREAEQDHDQSSEDPASKRLASCRYAATQGRLHTELKNFTAAGQELHRSLNILNSGEDNALYRRAIEYCFANLRLAENDLAEARIHYEKCLNEYDKAVTDKDQVRSCGCYYKLGHIALLTQDGVEAADQLEKAANIASEIRSMGWQGRIATLQATLVQQHPELAARPDINSVQLQRRADALRAALASLSAEEEGLGKEFHIYTPWQTR
ncbi:hypothetical protein AA0119_g13043 [Alternaria tenuissima]|nr:hypothetical protein AA0119_g13043 [Alternaria tenuissima]